MNVDYQDQRRESWEGLTAEQVAELAAERMANPEVTRIEILPDNRHDRRRKAAAAKRKPKSQRRKK